ncbi:MAG: flagellar hook-associated protein 3, partial [Gammaproteobacteria bacterium]
MSVRLSTPQMFRQGTNAILDAQLRVGETSLQVSTGKRILSPADDPSGAVQSLEVSNALAINSQFTRNADLARQKLSYEETVLQSIQDNIQRVRELVVQGNNDSQTPETRRHIAAELRQRFDELLQLSNSRDANGEYIFAGYRSDTQPFTRSPGNVVSYAGDDRQRFVQISPVRQVAVGDNGQDVFLDIPEGNGTFVTGLGAGNTGSGSITTGVVTDLATWQATTAPTDSYTISFTAPDTFVITGTNGFNSGPLAYQSGTDIQFQGISVRIDGQPATGDTFTVAPSAQDSIFETYTRAIQALEQGGGSPQNSAALHTDLGRVLEQLDQAQLRMNDIRARVGARLNALDTQADINSGLDLQLRTVQSSIQDLDYAEAISRFQQQLTGLQA